MTLPDLSALSLRVGSTDAPLQGYLPARGAKRKVPQNKSTEGAPLRDPTKYMSSSWTSEELGQLFSVRMDSDGFPTASLAVEDGVPLLVPFLVRHLQQVSKHEEKHQSFLRPSLSLSSNLEEAAKILVPSVERMLRYRAAYLCDAGGGDSLREWIAADPGPVEKLAKKLWPARDKQLMVQLEEGTAAAKLYDFHGEPQPSQPHFLPLVVSAPPRQGKSAIALLLVTIARKLGFTTLFSVAPNKNQVLKEMEDKIFSQLRWGESGMTITDVTRTPRCDDYAQFWDLVLYSSDVHTDVVVATRMVTSLVEANTPCFHIHDEGQTMAKLEARTFRVASGEEFVDSESEDESVEKSARTVDSSETEKAIRQAEILTLMRTNYPNSRGLSCLVSATMLPTYLEPIWGDIGRPVRAGFLEDVWHNQLLPHPLEPLRPSGFQYGREDTGYAGVDRLREVGTISPGPKYWRQGRPQIPPRKVREAATAKDKESIRQHFVEWMESESVPSDDKNHDLQPMYVATLTREQAPGYGGVLDWVNNMYVPAIKAAQTTRKQNVAILLFSSRNQQADLKRSIGLKKDMMPTDADTGVEIERGYSRKSVQVVVVSPLNEFGILPIMSADSCQDAIWKAKDQVSRLYTEDHDVAYRVVEKFAVLGYTMLEAAVTLQTDAFMQEGPNGAPQRRTYAVGAFCAAHPRNAPLDELFQMVGRAFADFKQRRFPDFEVKFLAPEGTAENLRAIAQVEKLLAVGYDEQDLDIAKELRLKKHTNPPIILEGGLTVPRKERTQLTKEMLASTGASGPTHEPIVDVVETVDDLRKLSLPLKLRILSARMMREVSNGQSLYDRASAFMIGKRRAPLLRVLPMRARRDLEIDSTTRAQLAASFRGMVARKYPQKVCSDIDKMLGSSQFMWEMMPTSDDQAEKIMFTQDCAVPVAKELHPTLQEYREMLALSRNIVKSVFTVLGDMSNDGFTRNLYTTPRERYDLAYI